MDAANSQTREHMSAMICKFERLIRRHRQQVFGPSGAAHERAIKRLKRSATFAELARRNREAASIRLGERLTRMGY